ncbi:hypothetical protein DFJ74DRAFT_695055 [Hyaloraphidium curvatum]|nr:hypothetical protein DFJ74DRAFT_695055 [Hyaloraphidium curvatum]
MAGTRWAGSRRSRPSCRYSCSRCLRARATPRCRCCRGSRPSSRTSAGTRRAASFGERASSPPPRPTGCSTRCGCAHGSFTLPSIARLPTLPTATRCSTTSITSSASRTPSTRSTAGPPTWHTTSYSAATTPPSTVQWSTCCRSCGNPATRPAPTCSASSWPPSSSASAASTPSCSSPS